jgi:hypothetical protein
MPDSKNYADNLLLRALAEEDRAQLAPGLSEVALRARAVIAEPHSALEYA